MRRIFFFSVLLLVAALQVSFGYVPGNSAAKKPSLVYELEATGLSEDNRFMAEDLLRGRLEALGVKPGDYAVTSEGNKFLVTIYRHEKYEPSVIENIGPVLVTTGRLAFWETYDLTEIGKPLSEVFMSLPDSGKLGYELFDIIGRHGREDTGPVLGNAKIADTSKVMRILHALPAGKLPSDLIFAWSKPETVNDTARCELVMLKSAPGGQARMTEPRITKAERSVAVYGYELISLTFSDAEAWRIMTKANTGRSVAITIDGVVYTHPAVQGEITGGVASITGDFLPSETRQLVAMLTSSPLPCTMRLVSKTIVG